MKRVFKVSLAILGISLVFVVTNVLDNALSITDALKPLDNGQFVGVHAIIVALETIDYWSPFLDLISLLSGITALISGLFKRFF